MRARRAFEVVLVAALMTMATPAVVHAVPVTEVPAIGLGYGPTTIEPVSVGIPVYTAGDQVWVRSYYNSTSLYISLIEPGGVEATSMGLGPQQLLLLYTIAPEDPAGNWTMQVLSSLTGTVSVLTFGVENVSAALEPEYVTAVAQGDAVALQYSVPPTEAYDIQACSLGQGVRTSSSFTLPSSIGGSIQVTLTGDNAVVSAPATRGPFTGWLELWATRSFVNGTSLLTEEALAARTPVMVLGNANGSLTAKLVDEMNLRDGRYDLRVYARGTSGLASYEDPLLKNGTGWVSLSGCTQLAGVSTGDFSLTTSLDSANSTWPRSLLLMYSVHGVDSASEQRIPVMEGRVDVRTGGGSRLNDATFVLRGSGVTSWSAQASDVYFVGNGFPYNLSIGVDFGGVASETYSMSAPRPFEAYGLSVAAGYLSVLTKSGGAPLANATVRVSEVGAAPASFSSGLDANETLMLPPGEYAVNASSSGKSASALAGVSSGQTSVVVLDVAPPQPPYMTYLLAGVLVTSVALNVKVWRDYLTKRGVYS